MTLPPTDQSFLVVGTDGPSYKVGPRCANPFCPRYAEHAHHLWRRSLLKGDYKWVTLPSGETFGNIVGLCVDCHERITGRIGGHRNAIRLETTEHGSTFYWAAVGGDGNGAPTYELLAPIEPQPPSPTSTPDEAAQETDACPTCGQARRRMRRAPSPHSGEPRRRKSWTLLVPADDEDGATVLDTLTEALAPVVGVEPDQGGRYYIVVAAMAHANSDVPALLKSLAGTG